MWLLICLSMKIVACELHSTDDIEPKYEYELNINHKEVGLRDNQQEDQYIPEQFVSKNQSVDGLFHNYNKTIIEIMKNKILGLFIENKTTAKNAKLISEQRIQNTTNSVTQPKFKIMLPVNKSDDLVSVKRARRWNDRHSKQKHRKKHYVMKHKRKGAHHTSKDVNISPNITALETTVIKESDNHKHPFLNMATNFSNKIEQIPQQTLDSCIKKTIQRYLDKSVPIVTSLSPVPKTTIITTTTPVPTRITSTTEGPDKMVSPWFTYPQQLFVLERNVQSDEAAVENRNMKENESFVIRQAGSESSDSEYNEFDNQSSYPSESVTLPTRKKKSSTIEKSLNTSILIKALQLIKSSLDSYEAYANYLAYKFSTYNLETFKIVEHQINDILYRADTGKLEGDKPYRTMSTYSPHQPPPLTYKMSTQTGGPPPLRHTVTSTAHPIDVYDLNNDFHDFEASMY